MHKIKLKKFEALNIVTLLDSFKDEPMSFEASEAVMETIDKISQQLVVEYDQPREALAKKYARLDKAGEPMLSEDKSQILLDKEKLGDFNREVIALANEEIELELESLLTKDHFRENNLKLSPSQLLSLKPYFAS